MTDRTPTLLGTRGDMETTVARDALAWTNVAEGWSKRFGMTWGQKVGSVLCAVIRSAFV